MINTLKVLPTNTGEFKIIRTEINLYVDKTEFLYSLIKHKGKKFFFSRPRRFGKSLTISTLEAILQGHKELFEGLWIYDKWDWKNYSVIRFDFSQISQFKSQEELINDINELIIYAGKINSVSLEKTTKWSSNLGILSCELKLRGPVAILIDEYDAPFHKAIKESKELLGVTTITFSDFFEFLKSIEINFDFMFITGITKIAKTAVFSGMNNITDVSYKPEYAALCGITQEELESNFKDHFESMIVKTRVKREDLLFTLKNMYNGYRFSPDSEIRVYNPFSLHHVFDSNKFLNYWFESGTPTLLINLIKNNSYDLSFLENPQLNLDAMRSSFDFSSLDIENLLFQTGYLTLDQELPIDPPSDSDRFFSLSFPNHEVKSAFTNVLLKSLREKKMTDLEYNGGQILKKALAENRWKDFA